MALDIIGPASAPGAVTVRPGDTRTFGATDTFFKDCTAPGLDDGTEFQAAWFNQVLANLRSLARGNGLTAGAAQIVTENNADDALLLKAVQFLIQRGVPSYAAGSGTANSIIAAFSPALSEYKAGQRHFVKINATNTGAVVANFNSLGSRNVKRPNGQALQPGDLLLGGIAEFADDGTQLQLISFNGSTLPRTQKTTYTTPGAISFTATVAGPHKFTVWGAGGGGGYSETGAAASGGSGGSYFEKTLVLAVGSVVTGVVGAGGADGTVAGNGGAGIASSITFNATTYTAAGGPGGITNIATGHSNSPSPPAIPTNGDRNIRGGQGDPGILTNSPSTFSGRGGSSPVGGYGGVGGGGGAGDGTAPGGGGGGSGGGATAGDGARGEIWVEF